MRSAALAMLRSGAIAALVAACTNAGATGALPAPTATVTATASPTIAPTIAAATPSPAPTATPAPDYTALPVAANDPDGIVKQLIQVDAVLHDPASDPVKVAYMGHLQQLAYSRLADYPEWQESVFGALPERPRAAAKGSVEAGKQLRSIPGPVPKTLPDWKIVDAAPAADLMSFYKEGEAQFGVPWYYLASINLVETRMGRIRGLSSAGAQGPMQFMPATWAQYGRGDVNNDHDAILGAARYLKAAGAPGDMQRALYAYNHSLGYVNALVAYADVMKNDPDAYRGYHGWQVYYPTPDGPVLLPLGWVKS